MTFTDPVDLEMAAYELFAPHIQRLCQHNWRFLEQEDRISEAAYIFIITLRTFPTNSGHFWQEYVQALNAYMQKLRAGYNRQKCWLSLDAPLRTKRNNEVGKCTLLDFLGASDTDSSDILVHRFLNTLPKQRRDILERLMDGKTRRAVCMRTKLKSSELERCLQEVCEDYRDFRLKIDGDNIL